MKILVAILFILTAVTLPEGAWIAYALLLLIIVVLASLARLGVGFTIKRSLIALPFVLAALPLPFLTPGEILFTIPILGWGVTTAGTLRFFTILVRTWIAVQAGVLLSATTKVSDILWGLGRLGVPRIIVATVGFMVRYLFVLADEALRMIRARISRSPRLAGARPPGFVWQGRTVGMMVGSLFLRSLERSERVYAAMVSRGYDGQLRTFEPSNMESVDWTALGISVLILVGILALGFWG